MEQEQPQAKLALPSTFADLTEVERAEQWYLREKLIGMMVGTLYPGVLRDEMYSLQKLGCNFSEYWRQKP